jgi:hypothetical protein
VDAAGDFQIPDNPASDFVGNDLEHSLKYYTCSRKSFNPQDQDCSNV